MCVGPGLLGSKLRLGVGVRSMFRLMLSVAGVTLSLVRVEGLPEGIFSDLTIWCDKRVITTRNLLQDVIP